MKISLSLKNFRKYKDEQFSMGNSIVKISGTSGAGKSTLLESIYYVLYGKLQRVKPRDSNGQTEVVMEFPYEDTTITIRRRNKNDLCVWLKEEVYEGDQAQGIIDKWFGTSESFLMSSYLKAESMHKFISATPSEKKEITYLLFPGVVDCEKYTTALKEAKKREEAIMLEHEKRKTRLNSSIVTLVKSHPWLQEETDIDVEDVKSLLPSYGLEEDASHTDVQKKAKECSSILGRYDVLVEQCVQPSAIDVEAITNRVEEIHSRLGQTTSSYSDIQRRIGEATSILSRYRTIAENNSQPEPVAIEDYKKRLEEIDIEIEKKKLDVCHEDVLPSLSDLQKNIRECYSILGRYDVLTEQNSPPEPIDMETISKRVKELRDEILSSRVGTESRESKLSYLRGTLESLQQDYNPDCIRDYELTRKLHSLCSSYESSKKNIVELDFQIKEKQTTLEDFEESLAAIEYNSKLAEILPCPSCGSSLRHTDKLHLVSDEDTPKNVLYQVTRDDVENLRMNVESLKSKQTELQTKIDDYDRLISINQHVPSLLEKHGSPLQYNRYIVEMKNRKERIDSLVIDIDVIISDDAKYVSQSEINSMNQECSELESKISRYQSDLSRYESLRSQVQSLLDKNEWLREGSSHIHKLEQIAQRLNDFNLFLSSSTDEKENIMSKIGEYEDSLNKYKMIQESLQLMLSSNPWLVEGDNYIKGLEEECQCILDKQREDEKLKKELQDLENSLSRYNSEMSVYLSNKSKVDNLKNRHSWLEKGEAYLSELESLSNKILDYHKKLEMKKVHTSYTTYKDKLANIEKEISSVNTKLDNIQRLLALINEAYRLYVDDKMKEIEYDICVLSKLFFDESMNVSIIPDKSERPSFDLQVEHEGVIYDDIKSMSTGERKRLSLIMMIVIAKYLDSKVMMLDEAFSSIGMEARGVVLAEICKMGIPILATSHDDIPGAYWEYLDLDAREK